jgi:capsular exopolysaccharide synthesis family protein
MLQHPTYRILKRQLEQYEREIEILTAEGADLHRKVKVYEDRLEHAPKREQDWLLLTRGYDVVRERYQALMSKKLDAQVSLKLEELQKEAKFRVLDPASLPLIPVSPNRYLIVAIGFIAGLAFGFGGVLLAEMSDSTVRCPSDLDVPARLPLLGCIPRFANGRRALPALTTAAEVTNGSAPDRDLIMLSDPSSAPAEQYRHLRTRVKHMIQEDGGKVLVITSAFSDEGKSVTAANLALAMALETEQNVLLIDAELRSPRIHKLFDLRLGPGLADVLTHTCLPETALQQGPVDRLMVLSAGKAVGNPADLISPRGMSHLLSELRSRFTYIILDSPPILPVADACVLSSCTDGAIMVARAEVTKRDAFTDALQRLGNGRPMGLVLNAVSPRLPGYRYQYYPRNRRYGKRAAA